jgi:YidC/Oxa1 family membrane protein insertase
MQMVGKVMPIFFGFISWTLPTGLVVYFLTGNIFRIGQQALIVKLDDREEVKKEEKKEENNEDPQSNPIQENPRKNRKKRRRK